MAFTESIVIGVVSGILTSACLLLFVQIFRNVVLPWYQSLVYSGLLIEGTWIATKIPSSTQDVRLELKQKAHHIEGTATYVLNDTMASTSERIRNFRIAGSIRERFVIMTLQHTDRERIGVAAQLLEVTGDGRRMHGGRVFFNVGNDKISLSDITFTREALAIINPTPAKESSTPKPIRGK
ncbi:hypothetical protein D4R75_11965 [bacterium]|nr:MAG: hypothetical protein D4R75_11965 [bacterium]